MAVFVDVNPGPVAENFLKALRNCNYQTLSRLARKSFLKVNDQFPALTYTSILYEGIEAYAKAANTPLCFFFFGELKPPIPQYTPFDSFVITTLNQLSQEQLAALNECVYQFFPNPIFELSEIDYRKRVLALMQRRLPSKRAPDEVVFAPYKDLDPTLIKAYLEEYARSHYNWIKLDTVIDVATYLGVSLHWILNLKKVPLFCNNVLADQIFSYYTLLPVQQRDQFVYLLWQCINVDCVHDYMPCMGGVQYEF